MNSQAGVVGEPGATGYCASKFAIEGESRIGWPNPYIVSGRHILNPNLGAVESLAKELQWLAPGIKPLIVESGIFGTEVMKNIHHVDSRVPFWKPLNDAARMRGQGNYLKPQGNAADMIAKVIQIVNGTGIAEGREIPLRVPFGSDCLATLRDKLQTLQKIYDEWESVARSTDFPGVEGPMPDIPNRGEI